jgi:Co/Zn/Cd efflux system component
MVGVCYAAGAYFARSVTLLTEVGHTLGMDVPDKVMSILVEHFAKSSHRRERTIRTVFGHISNVLLVLGALWMAREGWHGFVHPEHINGSLFVLFALVGMGASVFQLWHYGHSHSDDHHETHQAALLHAKADLVHGGTTIVVGSLVFIFQHPAFFEQLVPTHLLPFWLLGQSVWQRFDPLASLFLATWMIARALYLSVSWEIKRRKINERGLTWW